jgi:hypothetical protein
MEYYKNAVRPDTGRNALELVLHGPALVKGSVSW